MNLQQMGCNLAPGGENKKHIPQQYQVQGLENSLH